MKLKIFELENRRYEQNAKVVSLILYFPRHQELSKEFNEFLAKYQVFNNVLKRTAEQLSKPMSQALGNATPNAADRSARDLDHSLMALDEVYQILSGEMRRQITKMEYDNEHFSPSSTVSGILF